MKRILRSRAGAISIVCIVALLSLFLGVRHSVSGLYRDVADAKYNAAEQVIIISKGYPRVDVGSLTDSSRTLRNLSLSNSATVTDYRAAMALADDDFLNVCDDLYKELLTGDGKRDLDRYRSSYIASSLRITPFVENFLVRLFAIN